MNEVLKASLPSIISAALPTLMVMVGILVNRNDITRLDGRITHLETKLDGLETKIDGRITSLEAKIDRRITSLENKLDGRITGLENKLDGRISSLENRLDGRIERQSESFHNDILMLVQRDGDKDTRLARLEESKDK